MCGSVLGIDLNISTHTDTSASVHAYLADLPGLAPPRIESCDGPTLNGPLIRSDGRSDSKEREC